MIAFTTQRSIARNIALSLNAQETIGEVMADAALTYRARPDTSAFLQWEEENESDLNYAKGGSFATENRQITVSTNGSLSGRLDDFLAGWLFAFCMGQDNFTAGVNPAPNTHVFTWKDTGDPAQLTNVYAEDSAGLKRKWSDIGVSQIVLSGADKGSITAKATLLGLGTVTKGAMAAVPALPTAQYLYGSDSIVSIGPIGAPVSMNPRVLSWEATFDHQLAQFRATGGGVKPYFIRQGNPTNKLKLVIALDTSSDVYDWMVNRTALEVKIAATSGAASLTIDYPNVVLPKADLGEQDKLVAYTVELDENSILVGAAGVPVTVTVMNTQTAYLVAA
jgi:hypothetical protein